MNKLLETILRVTGILIASLALTGTIMAMLGLQGPLGIVIGLLILIVFLVLGMQEKGKA